MRKRPRLVALLLAVLGAVLGYLAATAQQGPPQGPQTTGVPGSPGATTTIDGRYLPNPQPKFGGTINLNAAQSKPWWAPRVVPPKGAPNVLLIMTDDCGFGAPSTFGGVIPTPALDRIAKNGLRYTNFHSTALCSPTRAALITGRNHHDAGGPDHGAQPPLGGLWRGHGAVHGLPRLQQRLRQGERDHWPYPPGEWLPDVVVRQEPQHA
jgi:arylsulfatase